MDTNETLEELREYEDLTLEEIRELAEEAKCDLVVASDTTLQLDIDGLAARRQYVVVLDILRSRFPDLLTPKSESWISKSGNEHVVLHLQKPLPVEERIMFQAMLGSDGKREALNLNRVRRKQPGAQEDIVLFKPRKATS